MVEWFAMLLALAICIMAPGIASAALLLVVAVVIVLEEISRPREDGNRSREQDRW